MEVSGVAFLNSKIHSRSWRGSPGHAHTRCFTRTWRVVSASPKLELRVDFGDWLIPAQLLLIYKTREQKRGHALGVRGRHEQRVGIHRSGLAEFAHSKAALENYPAAVHQSERRSR